MDKDDNYELRKTDIEMKDKIETYAAAAVARQSVNQYNSHDQEEKDQPSFCRTKDSQDRSYGFKTKKKEMEVGLEDDFFRQKPNSEVDGTEQLVRRQNLKRLFLWGTDIDSYIATNLYGRAKAKNIALDETLNENTIIRGFNLDETFGHQMENLKFSNDNAALKLNAFQTYIAIIKGYCALMILVLPKSFYRGGYIFSPITLVVSGIVQTICALKLVSAGKQLGLTSYSLIVYKALGQKAKYVIDFMIAATQFTFALSLVSFITTAFQSVILTCLGYKIWIWYIALALMFILVPVSWVRNISKFSFSFLIGNLCIMSTVIIVTIYLSNQIYQNGGQLGPNLQPINWDGYMSAVGFSCYAFEGIGVVMPIMQNCECPEKFDKILIAAILTLTLIYTSFGEFCYLALGDGMKKTFITEELDQKSPIIVVIQLIYSVNLICSYAIMIYPTNNILEDYLFNWTDKSQGGKQMKYVLQNISRTIVCLFAAYMAVALKEKLDLALSILGAVLCAPVAIFFPAIVHLKVVAKTNKEKFVDILLAILSVFVLVLSTEQSLQGWND